MNICHIIGNLTRDPDLRTTQTGINVCSFTVAVNRRKTQNNQDPGADYFKVTVWREAGENCKKYLAKGRKVSVSGPVSVETYTGQDGKTYANLCITASEVEFLTPRGDGDTSGNSTPAPAAASSQSATAATPQPQHQMNFTEVETDDLPF